MRARHASGGGPRQGAHPVFPTYPGFHPGPAEPAASRLRILPALTPRIPHGAPASRHHGGAAMRLRAMSCLVEVRVLQATVAVLALVPVAAGLAGAVLGIGVFEPAVLLGRDTDSTGRYLSGLLLAVGVGFWSTVPRIEREGTRFRLLTLIVVTGGLARLSGL